MHTVTLSSDPLIELHEDFLTSEECTSLINVARACDMTRSPTVGVGKSDSRTSSTCFLQTTSPGADALSRKIEQTIGVPNTRFERPQVAHYYSGELYQAHHDTVANGDANWPAFDARGGHRTHTVLIYLNDVVSGGETHFPKLDVTTVPVRGRAIVFRPSRNACQDPRLLHEARPPEPGQEKWVCQVWVRERTAT